LPSFTLQELTSPPAQPEDLLAFFNQLLEQTTASPVGTPATTASPSVPASSAPSTPPATGSQNQAALQERLQIARERLAEANRLREQRRQEEEKEREKNRREQGKMLMDSKMEREDAERKKMMEERKREQAAAEEHKRVIKAQIEADKAERRARQERAQQATQTSSPSDAGGSSSSSAITSSGVFSDRVGLSIRLLDGSTIKETFNSGDTLASVRNFIQQHLEGVSAFAIARLLPTHVFTSEEEQQTLQQLGLLPSASLVIKPRARGLIARHGFVWTNPMTWYTSMVALVYQLWDTIYYYFRMVYDPPVPRGPPAGATEPNSASSAKATRPMAGDLRTLRQRNLGGDPPPSKDDNLFYNGNSTQYGGGSE